MQLFVQNYQPWTAFYITTHCARTWVEWKTHSLSTNAGAGSFVRYVDLCTLNFQNLFDHWLGALAHANKISLRLHHHHINRNHEGCGVLVETKNTKSSSTKLRAMVVAKITVTSGNNNTRQTEVINELHDIVCERQIRLIASIRPYSEN